MKNLNYGVVGNCRSAALVSEKGSLDWWERKKVSIAAKEKADAEKKAKVAENLLQLLGVQPKESETLDYVQIIESQP